MEHYIYDMSLSESTLYNVYDPRHFFIDRNWVNALSACHAHNYWQVWYILDGFVVHNVFNRIIRQERGSFVLIPPFCRHQVDSRAQPARIHVCELSEDLMCFPVYKGGDGSLFRQIYLKPLEDNAKFTSPFIDFARSNTIQKTEQILCDLESAFRSANRQTDIQILLVRLFSLIADEYSGSFPFPDQDTRFSHYRECIQRVLEYIDERYTRPISLVEICRIATMSVSSFSYIFKSVMGLTLIEYINRLRVRRARVLLCKTDMPIFVVGLECGFRDVSPFDRIFKRQTGMSPGAYRLRMQNFEIGKPAPMPNYAFEPVEKYRELARTIQFM